MVKHKEKTFGNPVYALLMFVTKHIHLPSLYESTEVVSPPIRKCLAIV